MKAGVFLLVAMAALPSCAPMAEVDQSVPQTAPHSRFCRQATRRRRRPRSMLSLPLGKVGIQFPGNNIQSVSPAMDDQRPV